MPRGCIDRNQVLRYQEEGYILVEGMFDIDEIDLLGRAAREDRALDAHSFGKGDGEGGTVRLSLWNHPGTPFMGWWRGANRSWDRPNSYWAARSTITTRK